MIYKSHTETTTSVSESWSMMSKPVWLMDVDGVLNDWRAPQAEGWVRFPTDHGFNMTFDPTLMERILRLHNDGEVEVKWLTTWCHDANKMLREEFGFAEDLDVLGYDWYKKDRVSSHFPIPGQPWTPAPPLPFRWWKLCAVDEFVKANPDQRIIWADDDLNDDHEAQQFLKDHPQIHAVSPAPYLTHDEVDTIEEWIKA